MIIYIHGFCGSGEGLKAKKFREYYRDKKFIAPSLSYVPELAIKTLEELIESYQSLGEEVKLIGSSMGGYMSIYLSNKYNLKTVLINPAIYSENSFSTLKKSLGYAHNFYDNSSFSWSEKHMEMLQEIKTEIKENSDNFLLLLQSGDEVLHYIDTKNYFNSKIDEKYIIVDEGGSHSFEKIESKFKVIDDFLEV